MSVEFEERKAVRVEPPVDRRKFATPPKRAGRRGQSVINSVPGLAGWLEGQFAAVPRLTLREIERNLRGSEYWPVIQAAGYSTGRSTIHAYRKKWDAEERRRRLTDDGNEAGTLAAHGTVDSIMRYAYATLAVAIDEEVARGGYSRRLDKLIMGLTKLQTASARREAALRTSGAIERRVYASVRDEIIEILNQNPEARETVLAAIDAKRRERLARPDAA